MAGAEKQIMVELGRYFRPVSDALESPQEFARLLRRLGYAFDGDDLGGVLPGLAPLASGVQQLSALGRHAALSGFPLEDLAEIARLSSEVTGAVGALDATLKDIRLPDVAPEDLARSLKTLGSEVLDLLMHDYLAANSPLALHGLALLDVYRPEQVAAGSGEAARSVAYARHRFHWDKTGQLFRDPAEWARDSYGWGADFNSNLALRRLAMVIGYIGATANLRDMTEGQVAAFMPHLAETRVAPLMARAPLYIHQVRTSDGLLDTSARAELGLALFPVAGRNPPGDADRGLGLGPYLAGQLDSTVPVAPGMDLNIDGSFGATGGVVIALRPSGIEAKTGVDAADYAGAFGIELVIAAREAGAQMVLIGDPDATRLQLATASVKLGGEVSPEGADFYLAAGVSSFCIVIDPADDGLLGAAMSEAITVDAGDLVLGWRQGTGIYFEGGTNLGIRVPLSLNLGPLSIHELAVALQFSDPPAIDVTTSADLTLGPLFAFADGIGVKAAIVPEPGGWLGDRNLRFGFVPPRQYGIDLNAAPITGGGALSIGDHAYRGALALKLESFGLSVFAILNTRLPGGAPGYSFAGSIFGEFNVPLAFGFVLTGLGGVVGLNRRAETAAMQRALFAGNLDKLLFPADPIQNAGTILDTMAALLPVAEGTHLFGPAARIGWGRPQIIDVKLGVIVEVGDVPRIVLLGSLGVVLPDKANALIQLNLSFLGLIDFETGTIDFDAALVNSRILSFPVTGDGAIRTGWGPRIEHVAAFGGMHPLFPKPANLPKLRPFSINFGTNNPKLTLRGYQAITANSLQFGARVDLYAEGPSIWPFGQFAARGFAQFDTLIYFNPFQFDARLGGALDLLRNGHPIAGLGFKLHLRGPNRFQIDGDVWAHVLGIRVAFGISHAWGPRRSLPTVKADPVRVLRDALETLAGFEPIAPAGRKGGVGFVQGDQDEGAVDPLGGVRLVQRALPLQVAIQKIGEARIPASATRLDLVVYDGAGQPAPVVDASEDFVRGHFFPLSDGEKLRATAFERHKAGFELHADTLTGPIEAAIEDRYHYEVIEIPVDQADPIRLRGTASFATGGLGPIAPVRSGGPGARNRNAGTEPDLKGDGFVSAEIAAKMLSEPDPARRAPGDLQSRLRAGEVTDRTLTAAINRAAEAEAQDGIRDVSNPVVADYIVAAGAAAAAGPLEPADV